MRKLLLATAIAVTSAGPIAYADTSSSQTTTHTTTTNAESKIPNIAPPEPNNRWTKMGM